MLISEFADTVPHQPKAAGGRKNTGVKTAHRKERREDAGLRQAKYDAEFPKGGVHPAPINGCLKPGRKLREQHAAVVSTIPSSKEN